MTTQVPPPAGRGKVPVWRTAIGSYGFVFSNLGRFFALGWLLFLIAVAAQIIGVLVLGERLGWGAETLQRSPAYPAYVVATVLIFVVYFAMFLAFAVRWHRFTCLMSAKACSAKFWLRAIGVSSVTSCCWPWRRSCRC